jgi:hypothetical protein
MLIRQKESELLTKLANMLRAEERRPKSKRDHELIAAINQTMEDLKRQRKQRGQRGRDSPEDLRFTEVRPAAVRPAEVRSPVRPDPPVEPNGQGLAITQVAGRVMAKTILAKRRGRWVV